MHIFVYPLYKSVRIALIRYMNGFFTVSHDSKKSISYDNATNVADFQHVTIGRLSTIRGLRFYSRALSDHEIMKNHILDRYRFSLLE